VAKQLQLIWSHLDFGSGESITQFHEDNLAPFLEGMKEDRQSLVLICSIQEKYAHLHTSQILCRSQGWNINNLLRRPSQEVRKSLNFLNLAFKMNAKLGGVNHALDLEYKSCGHDEEEHSLKSFMGDRTMVVGVDVTHPPPGTNTKSLAAVVASTGNDFARFPGCVRVQKGRVEMVQEFAGMMRERIKLWSEQNKTLPEKIVIFLDGVSEGQFETVLKEEKSQL
jgi:hypothetical protein